MATKKSNGPQLRARVKGGKNPKTQQVDGQPLLEDGEIYDPGTELVLDADRAEALTHIVDIIGPVDPKAPDAAAK